MTKKLYTLAIAIFSGWIICSAQDTETVSLPPAQKTGGIPLMEALANRKSQRTFSEREISLQDLSNLLWAGFGVNREDGHRTAPSARGWNEIDIYVVRADGWFLYDPATHALIKKGSQDLREYAGTQAFVKTVPLNLVYVADFTRMTNTTDDDRIVSSAADTGFISQNVYLYCASAGLATVVRGSIDKPKAAEAMQLRTEQHIILAQSIGYPAH